MEDNSQSQIPEKNFNDRNALSSPDTKDKEKSDQIWGWIAGGESHDSNMSKKLIGRGSEHLP
jgi:hypothetical protein